MRRTTLILVILSALMAIPSLASAQRLQIHTAALAGTGVSIGMGNGDNVTTSSQTANALGCAME